MRRKLLDTHQIAKRGNNLTRTIFFCEEKKTEVVLCARVSTHFISWIQSGMEFRRAQIRMATRKTSGQYVENEMKRKERKNETMPREIHDIVTYSITWLSLILLRFTFQKQEDKEEEDIRMETSNISIHFHFHFFFALLFRLLSGVSGDLG